MKHSDKTSGFSLVELSVVLVIIGLLLAAITGGSHLIHTAKLNQTISEINGYVTAANNFKDKYKAWPGDMPNAESFLGVYNASTNPNGTVNGNGDELIGERPRAWQQLALSGLIAGKYTGVVVSSTNPPPQYMAGVNAPSVSSRTGAFYLLTSREGFFGTTGNALQLGASNSSGLAWGGALTASDAHLIDIKIDDGVANRGILYTIRSNDYGTGTCVNQGHSVALDVTVNYILTDPKEDACFIVYWLNKL